MKLEREPSNPYDCNAIAFMCQAEKDWERIGYVVSEALTDMNEAISNNKILKVYYLSILQLDKVHSVLQTTWVVCWDNSHKEWKLVKNCYAKLCKELFN